MDELARRARSVPDDRPAHGAPSFELASARRAAVTVLLCVLVAACGAAEPPPFVITEAVEALRYDAETEA